MVERPRQLVPFRWKPGEPAQSFGHLCVVADAGRLGVTRRSIDLYSAPQRIGNAHLPHAVSWTARRPVLICWNVEYGTKARIAAYIESE